MFFVKYYTELIQCQRDTLQHNSQAGMFKDTSGIQPSIYWSTHCVSACYSESGSILSWSSFMWTKTGHELFFTLFNVLLWSQPNLGVCYCVTPLSFMSRWDIRMDLFPMNWLCLEGSFQLNMFWKASSGKTFRGIMTRGLNLSLWSSSSSRALISKDSALILSLLKLTSTSRLITQTLLHPSICTIQPFPPGASFLLVLTVISANHPIVASFKWGVWWHIF